MALGRWTSRFLQLIGFAGLLVCIALAIAILLGRTWIGVAVGNGFATVDTTIADGLASIDDATARLGAGVGTLDELLGQIGSLPASSAVPAAVAARVSQVVDAYTPARDRYVEARAKARAALSYLDSLGRVVPGVEARPVAQFVEAEGRVVHRLNLLLLLLTLAAMTAAAFGVMSTSSSSKTGSVERRRRANGSETNAASRPAICNGGNTWYRSRWRTPASAASSAASTGLV